MEIVTVNASSCLCSIRSMCLGRLSAESVEDVDTEGCVRPRNGELLMEYGVLLLDKNPRRTVSPDVAVLRKMDTAGFVCDTYDARRWVTHVATHSRTVNRVGPHHQIIERTFRIRG